MSHYCLVDGGASLPTGAKVVVSVDDTVTCASFAAVDTTLATVQAFVPPMSLAEGLLLSAAVVSVWLFGHAISSSTAILKG